MIGLLRGVLLEKHPPYLVVDVHGVGYELEAPMSTFYDLPEVGAEVRLYTHLTIREDAHTLFGFAGLGERALFRNLIKVSGVGAKMALTILSGMSAEGFARCVEEEDSASLVRLPGVGRKTAERLIIEMRDRLPKAEGASLATPGPVALGTQRPASSSEEAVSALVALGYKPPEASRLVRAVDAAGLSSEEIIRQALRAAVKQ